MRNFKMKFYLFVAVLIVIGALSTNASKLLKATKTAACPKPIPCPPPNKRPAAVEGIWAERGASYFPIGDVQAELIMTEMLKGSRNKNLDQFRANACPRAKYLDGFVVNGSLVNEYGFGNIAQYNCALTSTKKWQLYCKFLGAEQEWNGDAWVTLTDHKTWGVSTRCYENNVYTWMAFANVPVLSQQIIKQIKAHVKSFGFEPKQALPISYPKTCPTNL